MKSTHSSVVDESIRPPTLTRHEPPSSNAYLEHPMAPPSQSESIMRSRTSDTEGGGDSDSDEGGNYDITVNTDDEGSQMDDLLYAIRTGGPGTDGSGYSASQGGDDDMQPLIQAVTRRDKPKGGSDQYRMRRISIADTHL